MTSLEQWKELHDKSKTTKRSLVVDFTASWCPPCRSIAPFFHDLSNKYPCTIFLKVDVDEMRQIAQSSGVNAMPTFHFFKNGSKVDELRGADRNALENHITQHYVEVELPEDEKPKAPGAKGEVKITKVHSTAEWRELQERTQQSDQTLVVDFWATWCGPCVKIAPFFEALSAKYPDAVFAKVDVDELEDVSMEENVNAMPTFKIYKSGKCVDQLEGAIQSALAAMVAKHA